MYLERITGALALKSCLAVLEGHLPRSFYFVQHIKLLMEFGQDDFDIYKIKEHRDSDSYGAVLIYCKDGLVQREKYAVFYEEGKLQLAAAALKATIDFSKVHMLNSMPEYQQPLLNLLYPAGANIEHETKCFSMALNDIERLPRPLPDTDRIVKTIGPDWANVISSNWKYNRPGIEEMIRNVLETRVGYGAFVDGQMVSWIILSKHGAMSNLHTFPEARGRGYATMVVNKLCRHIWGLGIKPFVDVEIDNHAGMALFKKFGFQVQENMSWITCRPKSLDLK